MDRVRGRAALPNWVTVVAVLASLPFAQLATAHPAAAAVRGLTIVTAVSATDSSDVKSATAFCPSYRHSVISGGGRVVGADGHVILQRLVPVDHAVDRYFATAAEDAVGFAGNWSVEAYAVCAEDIGGHQIVFRGSPALVGQSHNEVRVDCPDGTNLTGVGAEVSTVHKGVSWEWLRPDGQGRHMIAKAIHDLRQLPATDPRHPTDLPDFHIFGYAICAWAAEGYEVLAVGSPLANVPTRQLDVVCPFPKVLLGAGLTKTDYVGDVHVDAMFPSASVRATTIARKTWTHGGWALGAWAICGHGS